MIKPIGPALLIKVQKKQSSIQLLPGTSTADEETHAVVEDVGTKCSLGVRKGHEVMFKAGTQPVVVEQTESYDLLLIQEVQVAYVKNWTKQDEAEAQEAKNNK